MLDQVQLENLVAALKAADVTEHLGIERSALSRQAPLGANIQNVDHVGNGGKQHSGMKRDLSVCHTRHSACLWAVVQCRILLCNMVVLSEEDPPSFPQVGHCLPIRTEA